MIRPRLSKFADNEKGAAMVEFAIIFPLLLLVIFGVIEWGLYMYNRQVLTNAVREGARYGVLMRQSPRSENDDDENPAIKAKVVEYAKEKAGLITFGIDELTDDDVTIIPEPDRILSFGNDLTVRVDYDYRFLIFYPLLSLISSNSNIGDGNLPIRVESTMKME